jgi:5'(3')-deoxyribonucleotidase
MKKDLQRLIVDMDGVLADIYLQFIKFEEDETGIRQAYENLIGRPEDEAFKNLRKYVFMDGFFGNAPVIKGSCEALEMLNLKYELFVVSSATEFPQSLHEKHEWITHHFPFISWKQMVFCGLKSAVYGDIMIDDHFKNLDSFKGRTLLFSQPHNMGKPEGNHTRVNNWEEICTLI